MTGRYLVRRLAQGIFVLWAAFTVSFVILYLVPGDPVETMVTQGGTQVVDAATVDALRHEYGFDQSLPQQYASRLSKAVQGDFGGSIHSGTRVSKVIGDSLPETLKLTTLALVIALVLGVSIAMLSTYTRFRWLRELLLTIPSLGISVPAFLTGLVLLQLVSFRWGLLPAVGNKGFKSLILPALTLSIPAAAALAQVLAKSLRTTMAEAFIETARAKGAGRRRVLFRHALRNASIPTLTLVGIIAGELIANAVIVETVFSRVGMGRVTQAAVDTQDIPVVQGVVVVAAVIFVLVNLLTDVVCALIDPRLTAERSVR